MFSIVPLTFLICELPVTFAGPENSPDEDMSTSTVSVCVSHTDTPTIDFNHFKVHSRPRFTLKSCSGHLCCLWPYDYQPSLSIGLPKPSSSAAVGHLPAVGRVCVFVCPTVPFSVFRFEDAKKAAAFQDGPKM